MMAGKRLAADFQNRIAKLQEVSDRLEHVEKHRDHSACNQPSTHTQIVAILGDYPRLARENEQLRARIDQLEKRINQIADSEELIEIDPSELSFDDQQVEVQQQGEENEQQTEQSTDQQQDTSEQVQEGELQQEGTDEQQEGEVQQVDDDDSDFDEEDIVIVAKRRPDSFDISDFIRVLDQDSDYFVKHKDGTTHIWFNFSNTLKALVHYWTKTVGNHKITGTALYNKIRKLHPEQIKKRMSDKVAYVTIDAKLWSMHCGENAHINVGSLDPHYINVD
jgi:hypothetical protein